MDGKTKYKIEYALNSNIDILFSLLTTANGLKLWFADDVIKQTNHIEFFWGAEKKVAKITEFEVNKKVTYTWENDPNNTFLSFEIIIDDITGDLALSIVDFSESTDINVEKKIWDNQVVELHKAIGA